MSNHRIRPLAICVFHRQGRILVNEAVDQVKRQRFFRPLGGGIEFGEPAATAAQREIREELDAEIKGLQLLGMLENIFTYRGQPGHEIVFVYDGSFSDDSLYSMPYLAGRESNGEPFKAYWRASESFSNDTPLYPVGLLELLQSRGMLTGEA
jgi:ADP-ribose pyrophosphatase YjhB (NUDIX family)